MKIAGWVLVALVMVGMPAAWAQSNPSVNIEQRLTLEQMRATGLDQLTPAQLRLLNQLLGEQMQTQVQAQVQAEVETQVQARVAAVAAQPPARERERGMLMGLSDTPVRARVKGTVAGWEPGTVFDLDNGQQWKVLKGKMKLPRALTSPEIVLVPGMAGRWFLQVDEDMPKARVYRID